MITPFDDEGGLDLDGAGTLARWLAANGSDALVVAGTTGEAPVLSDEERIDLVRAVAESVTIPVIAGAGTNDTRHSMGMAAAATSAGAAGILVVTPYYNRPAQSGLAQHFGAVASSTHLPVMVYDIPVRTGRKIANSTMLELARGVRNIVAVKDASGDVAGAARLLAAAPSGFELYSGEDSLTLPLLAVGAAGAVSVASHWAGEAIGQMIAAFRKGDVEGARETNAALDEAVSFQSSERCPNPLPAKAMCRVLGLPSGQCRLPMGAAPPELEAEAKRLLDKLGDLAPHGR